MNQNKNQVNDKSRDYGFGHAAIIVSNPVLGFVLILICTVKIKSCPMIKPLTTLPQNSFVI